MAHNKRQLSKDTRNVEKPTTFRNPNLRSVNQTELMSKLGYSKGSPFVNEPYIDIHTPNGIIDMSNTELPLLANGRLLMPHSGTHFFPEKVVREIPLMQVGGNYNQKVKDIRPFVRYNNPTDSSDVSTVKMGTANFDGIEYAFPTIFPKEGNTGSGNPKDWLDYEDNFKKAFQEALKRGETFDFGKDSIKAREFGEGSWKFEQPLMQQGGDFIDTELSDEEIAYYRALGYRIEELE